MIGHLKCCGKDALCPYPICVNDLTPAEREAVRKMRRAEEIEEARAAGARTPQEIARHMGVGKRTVLRILAEMKR